MLANLIGGSSSCLDFIPSAIQLPVSQVEASDDQLSGHALIHTRLPLPDHLHEALHESRLRIGGVAHHTREDLFELENGSHPPCRWDVQLPAGLC